MTFSNCSKLASVTIPATVKKISDRSFNGCSALTNVIFDSENEYYSFTDGVLYNIDKTELCMCIAAVDSVTIPNTVTKIADYAFYTRRTLKSVTIPDSVASIGVYTFAYCDELTNVTIPNAVTSIGYHTFNGCKSLISIVIPDNVTIIENDAFTNCTGLTSITFENTSGWHVKNSETDVVVDVTDPATNVTLITDTYHTYDWYRE